MLLVLFWEEVIGGEPTAKTIILILNHENRALGAQKKKITKCLHFQQDLLAKYLFFYFKHLFLLCFLVIYIFMSVNNPLFPTCFPLLFQDLADLSW